jgi:hypothetical protein
MPRIITRPTRRRVADGTTIGLIFSPWVRGRPSPALRSLRRWGFQLPWRSELR